jgi:hypothetical protein
MGQGGSLGTVNIVGGACMLLALAAFIPVARRVNAAAG